MTLYIHKNYSGTYSLDEKITKETEVFGDWYQLEELPHNITYTKAMEIAKAYGASKVVLDF